MAIGSRVRDLGLFLLAALAVGCGGGGGSSSPRTATPKATIAWPERSRDLLAPSSALSVRLVLHRTDAIDSDLTFEGDRNVILTAHSETYTAGTTTRINGNYAISATFYADAGEAGAIVGTAGADVKVKADGTLTNLDGTPLGSINFTGTIASVRLVSDQSVRVGATTTLAASARDASNALVVVSPGSYTFALATGGSNATLAANGDATGVQLGTATATVAIDGITSSAASFSVIPAAATVSVLSLDTTDLAYSPVTGMVYATVFSPSPQVVPINPDNATAGTPITCAHTPRNLTVSTDGLHLYVAESDGTLERFSLPGGALEGTASLPAGTITGQMIALPNSPDSWVISTQDGSGNPQQAFVYDALTPRASSAFAGQSIAINQDGTKLYGSQLTTGNQYTTATIGSTGLTAATSSGTTDVHGRIHYTNGSIVGDDGTIADPTTGTQTGHLTFTTIDHVLGTVPNSNRVYYAAWDGKQVQTYDLPTATAIDSFPLGSVSGGMETATWCGPKRLAIRTFSGSPNEVLIVSGLP